jgi:hypothetical protein
MSNYTTQTAELHAVKVDTRVLNSNKIDTKKLFINGELFDPSDKQIKFIKSTIGEAKTANGSIDVPTESDIITQTSVDGEFFVGVKSEANFYYHILGIYLRKHSMEGYIEINVDVNPRNYYGYTFKLWESGDVMSELYGGISDNTQIIVCYC